MPEFYMILARKIIKIPYFYDICSKNLQNSRFLRDFYPKMSEFYILLLTEKYFFSNFRGGGHVHFTDRLSRKFAMQRYVDIPPHLTYVATLPCET